MYLCMYVAEVPEWDCASRGLGDCWNSSSSGVHWWGISFKEESSTLCIFSTAVLQKCACLMLEFDVRTYMWNCTYVSICTAYFLTSLSLCSTYVCAVQCSLFSACKCTTIHILLPLTGLTMYLLESRASLFYYFLLTCSSNIYSSYSGIAI